MERVKGVRRGSASWSWVCDSDDRETWLARRKEGIGASESAAILGLSPWESPYSLYWKIKEPPEPRESEAMEWGLRLEPMVAEKFRDRNGVKLRRHGHMLRSKAYPWLTCTPDYQFQGTEEFLAMVPWVHRNDDLPREKLNGWHNLEIKTASAFVADEWSDAPPRHYRCQMQHQLAVLNTPIGAFGALIGGQRYVQFFEQKHEAFQEWLLRETKAFWERLERDDPPPPDDTTPTSRTLMRLAEEGRIVELSDQALYWHQEALKCAADEKAAKERKDEYRRKIMQEIGVASFGLLKGSGMYSFRTTKASEYTVKRKAERRLIHVENERRVSMANAVFDLVVAAEGL